jgi:nucleoside-diphosphate kinase
MKQAHPKEERTLVLIKPDALQRHLLGEIIHRFERKGLNVIGLKMLFMDDKMMMAHYGKYADKGFFKGLTSHMSKSPIVAMVISGIRAVTVTRMLVGQTKGYEATPGTIRGDFALSIQSNLVHASDPEENPSEEVSRFFKEEELFNYQRLDFELLYGEEELE